MKLDSSSSSNNHFHGHTLYSSSFSFNAISNSSSYEWLIDPRTSYHIAKDEAIFLLEIIITPIIYLLVMTDLLLL